MAKDQPMLGGQHRRSDRDLRRHRNGDSDLGGSIAWAIARALHASDVAAEIPTEDELHEPVSAIPHLEGHAPIE